MPHVIQDISPRSITKRQMRAVPRATGDATSVNANSVLALLCPTAGPDCSSRVASAVYIITASANATNAVNLPTDTTATTSATSGIDPDSTDTWTEPASTNFNDDDFRTTSGMVTSLSPACYSGDMWSRRQIVYYFDSTRHVLLDIEAMSNGTCARDQGYFIKSRMDGNVTVPDPTCVDDLLDGTVDQCKYAMCTSGQTY